VNEILSDTDTSGLRIPNDGSAVVSYRKMDINQILQTADKYIDQNYRESRSIRVKKVKMDKKHTKFLQDSRRVVGTLTQKNFNSFTPKMESASSSQKKLITTTSQ
jgi:hypothetical protein